MSIEVTKHLEQLEVQLMNKPRVPINFSRNWSSYFDNRAGVYAVFDRDDLIYVGETGNLKERMKDIRRTVNHSFRRSLGKQLFSHNKDFQAATSKKKFDQNIETSLNKYCEKNISIAAFPVELGRKELEEVLTAKHFDQLLNIRQRRKQDAFQRGITEDKS
jgi:hypothetical protein